MLHLTPMVRSHPRCCLMLHKLTIRLYKWIIRFVGPFGQRLTRAAMRRRISLTATTNVIRCGDMNFDDITSYSYHNWALKASTDIAIYTHLHPVRLFNSTSPSQPCLYFLCRTWMPTMVLSATVSVIRRLRSLSSSSMAEETTGWILVSGSSLFSAWKKRSTQSSTLFHMQVTKFLWTIQKISIALWSIRYKSAGILWHKMRERLRLSRTDVN